MGTFTYKARSYQGPRYHLMLERKGRRICSHSVSLYSSRRRNRKRSLQKWLTMACFSDSRASKKVRPVFPVYSHENSVELSCIIRSKNSLKKHHRPHEHAPVDQIGSIVRSLGQWLKTEEILWNGEELTHRWERSRCSPPAGRPCRSASHWPVFHIAGWASCAAEASGTTTTEFGEE